MYVHNYLQEGTEILRNQWNLLSQCNQKEGDKLSPRSSLTACIKAI